MRFDALGLAARSMTIGGAVIAAVKRKAGLPRDQRRPGVVCTVYNQKVGERIVLGAEAGISAGFDDELRGLSGGNALTIDPRYSFDLTARAGYLVNDKTLVYLRGGYANTRVRATLASDTDVVTTSDNLDGWLVGGGAERALTDDISARLEYRYTDLGSDGGEFDQHQALVGISYNF